MVLCPACGSQNLESDRFCEQCGANMDAAQLLIPSTVENRRQDHAQRLTKHPCPWCTKINWDTGEVSVLPLLWRDEGLYPVNTYKKQRLAWLLVFTCQTCAYTATFNVDVHQPLA